jgi:hypothetical protein
MRSVIGILLISTMARVAHASEALPVHEQTAVTIRVYDYADVQPEALAAAQRLVERFYAAVGVRTEWMGTCAAAAADTPAVNDLVVILLDRRMAARRVLPTDSIGSAAVSAGERGRVAYVNYDRVVRAATAASWWIRDLLAVVMAHEMGHLLLPPHSHSAFGLMRGQWSVSDLRRTRTRDFAFTRRQGALMRETLRDADVNDRVEDAPCD